ncbi:cytochrome P450 [Xylariaceae sp. FL0804]|nr:cytochrome P450 [Xylariaceae sp. FL0804]
MNSTTALFSRPSAGQVANDTSLSPAAWAALAGLATLAVGGLHYLAQVLGLVRWTDKKGNRIPDGPQGLPILGSFPFLTHYPELTLDKWAKKFGDLFSLWLGEQLFMIISSPEIAKDLIVTNGNNFSSRKEMFIKSQIVFAGRGITATPYNERWAKHRRIATGWLNQKAVNGYTEVLDREATDMISALYDECDNGKALVNPQPFAGRCSLNNMLTITFGMRTESVHNPLVKQALKLSRGFMNCTGPMSNMIDFVPILQKLPSKLTMAGRAQELHKGLVDTYGGLINQIERNMEYGMEVPDSLAKTMINAKDSEGLDHLDMAILASAFMIGGVETTASIMQWFMALIPSYPEIQKKAQAELDRVVGRDRMPTVEDEAQLPYCHAIVKEIERCHNPFWLGTPHVASDDFVYRGKFIPKGTVMVLNTYTMHHDEQRHPNPEPFNPDRYLDDHLTSSASSNLADPNKRDHWMFGAGRRICPGMWVAEREIWLAVSRLIWAFDLVADAAHPIDLKEYDGLSGRSPVPFQVYLRPRHAGVESVVKAAMV